MGCKSLDFVFLVHVPFPVLFLKHHGCKEETTSVNQRTFPAFLHTKSKKVMFYISLACQVVVSFNWSPPWSVTAYLSQLLTRNDKLIMSSKYHKTMRKSAEPYSWICLYFVSMFWGPALQCTVVLGLWFSHMQ